MDVSIIIVNYNTKELIRNCLKSIFEKTDGIVFEVIVSDNGSSDGSVEMIRDEFPQVILILNNENLGFGAANNRGLKIAKGKYIFYLNSDTVLLNNAVKIFFDYWENSPEKEKIGALGCNLRNNNNEIAISFANFPTVENEKQYLLRCFFSSLYIKKLFYHIKKERKRQKYIGAVEFIIGADLFLKNDEYAKFDEYYFMYYEESDLQLKLENKRKKRLIVNGPEILHFEGGSDLSNKLLYDFNKKTSIHYWISCLKYIKKNLKDDKSVKHIKTVLYFIYSMPNNRKSFELLKNEVDCI